MNILKPNAIPKERIVVQILPVHIFIIFSAKLFKLLLPQNTTGIQLYHACKIGNALQVQGLLLRHKDMDINYVNLKEVSTVFLVNIGTGN